MLTPARAGLARSDVTRSGYPIAQGVVLPLYALSGVARAGATRSNFHAPTTYIAIDGVQYGEAPDDPTQTIVMASLTIIDELDSEPTRARFRCKGFKPGIGKEVVVTLGSINNRERFFGGNILTVEQSYFQNPRLVSNRFFDVEAIDYTWGLNKRKVTGYFTGSATSIIRTIIETYAPAYTAANVEDDLPTLEGGITATNEDVTDLLTRIMKRLGGYWYADYYRVIHAFVGVESGVTNPTPLNAVHPSLSDFKSTVDLSQMVTRATVTGGGGNALESIQPGESIIPVSTPDWYDPAGGIAEVGSQHVAYDSMQPGGAGTLVGPGAAPASALVAALADGSGVEDGQHDYALTFVTAAGESIASPLASLTLGPVAAPASGPIAGAPTIGSGPDPGSHDYAVSFVTAGGETTPSPVVTRATGLTADPATAPTPDTPTSGGSIDGGSHEYAASFVTAIGETLPSPISGAVTTVSESTAPSVFQNGVNTPRWAAGDSLYFVVTQIVSGVETVVGATNIFTAIAGDAGGASQVELHNVPIVTGRRLYRNVNGTWVWADRGGGSTIVGSQTNFIGTAGAPPNTDPFTTLQTVPLTGIPLGGANVTARKLYRRSGGMGLKLLATIANNTATTYTDTAPNSSLGADAPTVSTAYLQRIPLSAIPTGSAVVIARNLWRTVAGGTQLKFLATLNDNLTTTFNDTVTDASLGADAPTVSTAQANQAALSSIPIGAAAVTARKIYRTAANQSQLKLLTTIADNVTTTHADSAADSSLGANVPTVDTSGLQQPAGNVPAGSTSLLTAGTGWASPTGGWAVIGNGAQVIRYTGITGSSLTGIPASGPGSITATVGYNSTVTAAAQLMGIPSTGAGAILYSIPKGEPVNLYVIVDDEDAQAELAELIGGDGIQEAHFVDSRIGQDEAIARGEAMLEQDGFPNESITYRSRDLNAWAGRTAVVNLGAPTSVSGSFKLQRVTISQFGIPGLFPTNAVLASSRQYSFEDLVRQARKAA